MKNDGGRSFEEQEEIDAEKRALRILIDKFHVEEERELAKALVDTSIQKKVGLFIARHALPVDMLQPHSGPSPALTTVRGLNSYV